MIESTKPWYSSTNKAVLSVGAFVSAVVVVIQFIVPMVPTYALAAELNTLRQEVLEDRYERTRKANRALKIEIYQLQQSGEPVPPFVLEEQMELEEHSELLKQRLIRMEVGNER